MVASGKRYKMLRKMKIRLIVPLLAMLLLLPAGPAAAGDHRYDFPSDDRRELRRQMRENWRQDAYDRRQQRDDPGQRWQEWPREERQRLRDEMRQQHERQDRDWRHERRHRRD